MEKCWGTLLSLGKTGLGCLIKISFITSKNCLGQWLMAYCWGVTYTLLRVASRKKPSSSEVATVYLKFCYSCWWNKCWKFFQRGYFRSNHTPKGKLVDFYNKFHLSCLCPTRVHYNFSYRLCHKKEYFPLHSLSVTSVLEFPNSSGPKRKWPRLWLLRSSG